MSILITVPTTKPLHKIRDDLTAACAALKFGVLGVHDLKAKLIEKGQKYERECLVFEVCQPEQARKVLENNAEIATALPCRIAVIENPAGGFRISTIRPTLLLDMYGSSELKPVAEAVERDLTAIMERAAR